MTDEAIAELAPLIGTRAACRATDVRRPTTTVVTASPRRRNGFGVTRVRSRER